ncbi:MAG TPA: potassium channel protein [Candidatus Acidoferrales bacterium]|nr:potassium channel protein [Candidatus Acidoferrales bacterium]
MNRFARRFLIIGTAILVTLTIGTAGFHLIDHYPLFDAFYMTLTTMTTVGYMEVHPLSQAGRIFNSFLIAFGVTTIFIAIGAMTQTIIELEFGDVIGKRRKKRMIDKLKDHYIICGFGRVGRGAAQELQHAGAPFVVVDIDPERVEGAMSAGMLAVAADSTRDETLREVGVERARGLVAALATDADNLFVLLSAKGINPKLYAAARAAEESAEEKMRRAGADAVFAPYSITGHRLAQSLLRPHVVQFLDFTTKDVGEDIAIEQVRVAESSEMVSRTIKDMQLRKEVGVIVMAIRKADGRMMFNPPADTAVEGGDFLIVMGRPENLGALENLLAGQRPARK